MCENTHDYSITSLTWITEYITYTHNTVGDLNEAFRSKFVIRGGQLMHHVRYQQDYSFETQILSKVRSTQSTKVL